MKAAVFKIGGLITAVLLASVAAVAGDGTPGENTTTAGVSQSATPPLAPGVADILKLSQAKVGDSVIVAFIGNSGTVYSLDANQIVYLRDGGVSEPVISAMLSQKQRYAQLAANAAAPSASSSAAYQTAPPTQPVYVEAQPAETPASSVYVIPYQSTWPGYGYYNYFPVYTVFYGGFGFDRFHQRFGFRSGFPNRFGFNGSFHSSFQGNFGRFHSGFHGQFTGRR